MIIKANDLTIDELFRQISDSRANVVTVLFHGSVFHFVAGRDAKQILIESILRRQEGTEDPSRPMSQQPEPTRHKRGAL